MTSKGKIIFSEYHEVFDNHIQKILYSGLILEEDMEILLPNYHFCYDGIREEKSRIKQVLVGGASIAATALVLYKRPSVIFTVIASSPVILLALETLRKSLYQKHQKINVQRMIESISKVAKLNRSIGDYFHQKRYSTYSDEILKVLNPYTKGVEELIETVFREETIILKAFREFIKEFYIIVPSFNACYDYLEQINFDTYNTSHIENIKDCIEHHKGICDIFVLVSSHCLTCFSLMLCPTLWVDPDLNVNVVIDTFVRSAQTILNLCLTNITNKFDNVKYYFMNKSFNKLPIKHPKPNAASRLKVATYNTVAVTSEILEKSRHLFQRLEKANMEAVGERESLSKCINDLKCHVYDYYESLDSLLKLYEVNINASDSKRRKSLTTAILQDRPQNSMPDFCDETSEPPGDEFYELYIQGDEEQSEASGISIYEEGEARKFAAALSSELKEALKSHGRFVDAMQRYRVQKEENVQPEPEPIPKFKFLQEVNVVAEPLLPDPPAAPLPPPIPPPLPQNIFELEPPVFPVLRPIDIRPGHQQEEQPYTIEDFFESILRISNSREVPVEVYEADAGGSEEWQEPNQ